MCNQIFAACILHLFGLTIYYVPSLTTVSHIHLLNLHSVFVRILSKDGHSRLNDICKNSRFEKKIYPTKFNSTLTNDAFVEKICNNIEYERILSAIVSMKDIYKEVMYYHFVMDLSIPEVAKMLNCKVSTVKQRLVRGKKLLYAQLFGGESNDSRE